MEKTAELFSVSVTELLDEFNLFLYRGQGRQIREMRENRRMIQAEFARRLGDTFQDHKAMGAGEKANVQSGMGEAHGQEMRE